MSCFVVELVVEVVGGGARGGKGGGARIGQESLPGGTGTSGKDR